MLYEYQRACVENYIDATEYYYVCSPITYNNWNNYLSRYPGPGLCFVCKIDPSYRNQDFTAFRNAIQPVWTTYNRERYIIEPISTLLTEDCYDLMRHWSDDIIFFNSVFLRLMKRIPTHAGFLISNWTNSGSIISKNYGWRQD